MADIDGRRPAHSAEERMRWLLVGVYGLLSFANLASMIVEPTAWQGAFAVALLVAAIGLWLHGNRRVLS